MLMGIVTVLLAALAGGVVGILIPVVLACISHYQHKKNSPGKPDTHSGAFSFVIMITAPVGAIIGGLVGLAMVIF